MSGHSKWSTIKRKKGAADAKRGKIFTKLIKEITVAVKMGGPDPDANPRLRMAIINAKSNSMPLDNVKRAIAKASGEGDASNYTEIIYEGYGAGGVAVIVEVLTDNKNRAVSEVRHAFSRSNGNLGSSGSVGWMFHKKGSFLFEKESYDEDQLMEMMLEAGGDDIVDDGDIFQVICEPSEFENVKSWFDENDGKYAEAEVTMIPDNTVCLTQVKDANNVLKLINMLEDCDDVQNVYANFEIDDAIEDQIETY